MSVSLTLCLAVFLSFSFLSVLGYLYLSVYLSVSRCIPSVPDPDGVGIRARSDFGNLVTRPRSVFILYEFYDARHLAEREN